MRKHEPGKRSSRRASPRPQGLEGHGTGVTIGEAVARVLGRPLDGLAPPVWPPDLFAVAASLLKQGDAYRRVVNDWPPGGRGDWGSWVGKIAARWRRSAAFDATSIPREVHAAWRRIARRANTAISGIVEQPGIADDLLALLAIADEASRGAGFVSIAQADVDGFVADCALLLDQERTTLGREVDASRAVVLPKVHTPQSGMTIRSLSHHLALVEGGEVRPDWEHLSISSPERDDPTSDVVRLLLLPFPLEVSPRSIVPVEPAKLREMDDRFGFFRAEVAQGDQTFLRRCVSLVERAKRTAGGLDAVIFPECALSPGFAARLCRATNVVVIGGVGGLESGRSINRVEVAAPDLANDRPSVFHQSKHHRWRMDGAQVIRYGLSGQLSPRREWWEDFEIERREVKFWTLHQGLTLCVLICEDLARPDPGADVVRAVGPDLVVSLLLDGPQLAHRWPGRYATVLADDPGSSVLTLTSLGMALLSNPDGKTPSRTVGLWKDPASGVREIHLPAGAEGLVLMLRKARVTEWSADGRRDDALANRLLWAGVQAIGTTGQT